MRLRRLGWAGIELEANGEALVIDHLLDPGLFKHFLTDEADELVEPDPGAVRAALVTHLHRDHTDVAAIERATGADGLVLRPHPATVPTRLDELSCGESERRSRGCGARGAGMRSRRCGRDRSVHGDRAVRLRRPRLPAGLVAGRGRRPKVLHGGDTAWHGRGGTSSRPTGTWMSPACRATGPGHLPGWEPAVEEAAVMTPEQSVDAAHVLGAGILVPIHFNRTFESPEYYRPAKDAAERISKRAEERGQGVRFAEPGEWLEVGAA